MTDTLASGDLRNVIRTINGLPLDYSGKLTVVMNDLDASVTLRNILLLQILGTVHDKRKAIDIALHFWYSAFMPAEYRTLCMTAVTEWLIDMTRGEGYFTSVLVNRCSATLLYPQIVVKLLRLFLSEEKGMSVESAQAEYNRVRQAPSRQQDRNTLYSTLRPSHRVAFK